MRIENSGNNKYLNIFKTKTKYLHWQDAVDFCKEVH